MSGDSRNMACQVLLDDSLRVDPQAEPRRRREEKRDQVVGPWTYRAKVGRGTIRLSPIEYRILMFLASKPYRAFSRRRIAEAVSTAAQPVTPQTLGRYILSLRYQLGFYGDLIQSVPYIGYRFKA